MTAEWKGGEPWGPALRPLKPDPSISSISVGPLRLHLWPSALWWALFRWVLPILLGCELPGHCPLTTPTPSPISHGRGGGKDVIERGAGSPGSVISGGRHLYPHL